jgi:hypothetical protein
MTLWGKISIDTTFSPDFVHIPVPQLSVLFEELSDSLISSHPTLSEDSPLTKSRLPSATPLSPRSDVGFQYTEKSIPSGRR